MSKFRWAGMATAVIGVQALWASGCGSSSEGVVVPSEGGTGGRDGAPVGTGGSSGSPGTGGSTPSDDAQTPAPGLGATCAADTDCAGGLTCAKPTDDFWAEVRRADTARLRARAKPRTPPMPTKRSAKVMAARASPAVLLPPRGAPTLCQTGAGNPTTKCNGRRDSSAVISLTNRGWS